MGLTYYLKEVTKMAKIGRGWRLWLKGFHVLFFILWIGCGVSELAILSLAGNASNGTQLHAYYQAMDSLDIIIIPCCILTLVTGLLITWLGGWGFRHFFVMYSLGVMIITLVIANVVFNSTENTLFNLSDTQGLQALQNPDYHQAIQVRYAVGIIYAILQISVAFVSIFKPLKSVFSATKKAAVPENIA
jgi:uncharacterized membrane protein